MIKQREKQRDKIELFAVQKGSSEMGKVLYRDCVGVFFKKQGLYATPLLVYDSEKSTDETKPLVQTF